ncbi:MAG: penicillin-binding protein 2 [Acidimicrobiia bacterium]|nr:penicillin-binding protein 2 [Acidimicrobiia bacterium]
MTLAWRAGLMGMVFFALLAVLSLRMWQLQVAEGQEYAERAESNQVGFAPTPAPRGEIRDANGVLLAGTRPALAAVVDAKILSEEDEPQLVAQLSALLGLSVEEVQMFIDDVQARGDRVPIVSDLTDQEALFITEHGENFPGVEVEPQPIRTYPLGELASDIVGFIGLPQPADVEGGAEPTVLLGRAGLEKEYDSQLQGTPGQIVYRFDARRQGDVLSEDVPTPGNTLFLTIDTELQRVVEESLAEGLQLSRDLYEDPDCVPGSADDGGDPRCPVRAAGVVMDVTTGAVLAMASVPTYDPNIFIGGVSQAELDALPDGVFNNFAIQGEYAPASTYKAVTYFTAYEEGMPPYSATNLEEEILCSKELRLPFLGEGSQQVFRNWTGRDDGLQNIHRAFTRSCNVYFWEIAAQIWNEKQGTDDESILQDWARDFGFGEPTSIDLPFERKGLVPDRALFELWKEETPQRLDPARLSYASPWLGGDLMNAALGQGEVLVTPLQLANAYAAMVNGGSLWEPYVVDHIENLDGDVVADHEPTLLRSIDVSPQTVANFRRDMQQVVNDPAGTAYSAFEEFGDNVELVGGKTGTAEIIKETEEQEGVTTALFAAVAPVNQPRYVVVVVIERGGSGGRIAAPTARPILQYLLNGANAVTPIDAGEDAD